LFLSVCVFVCIVLNLLWSCLFQFDGRIVSQAAVDYLWLLVFWPPVCSFWLVWLLLCCGAAIACINLAIRRLRSHSEKVAKLKAKSVLVVEEVTVVPVFIFLMLFLGAWDVFVAVVWKVEIDPVKKRLSCIFAIVSAGVVAPGISISTLVSGKIKPCWTLRCLPFPDLFLLSCSVFLSPTMHP